MLTRRRMLQSLGATLTSTMLPMKSQSRPLPASEIMAALSMYMSAAGSRQLPDEITEKTKHVILDAVAAMVSGSELPPGRFAIQFARAYKGERVATVAGSNVVCGPIEAALANGMRAHAD